MNIKEILQKRYEYNNLYNAKTSTLYHIQSVYKSFIDNYDDNVRKIIEDIKKNGHTYDHKTWSQIVEAHIENNPILITLVEHPSSPIELFPAIATLLFAQNIEHPHECLSLMNVMFERKDIDTDTVKELLDIAIKATNYESFSTLYSPYRRFYRDKDDCNHMVVCKIAETLPGFYSRKGEGQNVSQSDKDYLSVLDFVRDEKVLREILDSAEKAELGVFVQYSAGRKNRENILEHFRAAIVNNQFISDEMRNEIFNEGVPFEYIQAATPYIADVIYEAAATAYFEDNRAETVESYQVFHMLQEMASKKILTPPCEIDLMNRLLDLKLRMSNQLTENLLRATKNPDVLRLATKIKSKDIRLAYENKAMPVDEIFKRIDGIKKKVDGVRTKVSKEQADAADITHGVRYGISDNWRMEMADFSARHVLREGDYELMLDEAFLDKKMLTVLALSPCAPNSVLEKIATIQETDHWWGYIGNAPVIAAMNLYERKHSAKNHSTPEERETKLQIIREVINKDTGYRSISGKSSEHVDASFFASCKRWEKKYPSALDFFVDLSTEMLKAYPEDNYVKEVFLNCIVSIGSYRTAFELFEKGDYENMSNVQCQWVESQLANKYMGGMSTASIYGGIKEFLEAVNDMFETKVKEHDEMQKEKEGGEIH